MIKNIQHAEIMGKIAYAKGLPCAPVLNAELMDSFKGRDIGDKNTIKEMKAYMSGWTSAHLLDN